MPSHMSPEQLTALMDWVRLEMIFQTSYDVYVRTQTREDFDAQVRAGADVARAQSALYRAFHLYEGPCGGPMKFEDRRRRGPGL